MSDQGNIFFNKETLAFSMPLILICGSYAYFKFVPLDKGLPILGVVVALLLLRSKVAAHKADKLQNMDAATMDSLAAELEDDEPEPEKKPKNFTKSKKGGGTKKKN